MNPSSHLVIFKVECWKLKFALPPPKVVDLRKKVEVSSVNWKSQPVAASAVALVLYKWHGIMYATDYITTVTVSPLLDAGMLLNLQFSGTCP